MSTTTHPTREQLEALHQRLCDARMLGETYEILMYGAQHGLIAIDEIDPTNWASIQQLTSGTSVEAAWQAEQRARSVPLECPVWCDGEHGLESDPLRDVLVPFDRVASHSVELARCELTAGKYSVDLVREQAHPESGHEGREFVVLYGLEDAEIEPAKFGQVAESLTSMLSAARRRLAEITAAE